MWEAAIEDPLMLGSGLVCSASLNAKRWKPGAAPESSVAGASYQSSFALGR